MTQWDRGIYILYDSLNCAQVRPDAPSNLDTSKRLNAATALMSPKLLKLHGYCQSYSNHLEASWLPKIKIYSQYSHDCLRLFSAGRLLVEFCRDCIRTCAEISTRSTGKRKYDWRLIQQRQILVQENPISANLAKSTNLIKGIILAKP